MEVVTSRPDGCSANHHGGIGQVRRIDTTAALGPEAATAAISRTEMVIAAAAVQPSSRVGRGAAAAGGPGCGAAGTPAIVVLTTAVPLCPDSPLRPSGRRPGP